jgi:hypothetical protein
LSTNLHAQAQYKNTQAPVAQSSSERWQAKPTSNRLAIAIKAKFRTRFSHAARFDGAGF